MPQGAQMWNHPVADNCICQLACAVAYSQPYWSFELFAKGNEMYSINRQLGDSLCIYKDLAIYSPKVPVIRDSERQLELLQDFVTASFITVPAPNAGVARRRGATTSKIKAALTTRIDMVLGIAALNGHEDLVLGALGCGVFGNSPENVAEICYEKLEGPYRGRFARVVFAVLDRERGPNFVAFKNRFSSLMEERLVDNNADSMLNKEANWIDTWFSPEESGLSEIGVGKFFEMNWK